jgi:hypothetical protein
VVLYIDAQNSLAEAVREFEDYLMSETLAVSIKWEKREDARTVDVGGESAGVAVEKA